MPMKVMNKDLAVIINDIHFSKKNLVEASTVLKMALDTSVEKDVPLIIAGDLMDGKSVMPAEVVNELLRIKGAYSNVYVIIASGNHDLFNEKSSETSLEFLSSNNWIVLKQHQVWQRFGVFCIGYQSDKEVLLEALKEIPKGSTIITHQGVQGADMGHYVLDNSSLPPEVFADYRVISGHYHKKQDIKCGRPRKGAIGLFTYTGNPYTQSFGEANDGEKGFHILKENGLLEFIPTNLRKHIVVKTTWEEWQYESNVGIKDNDLLMVKISGSESELNKLNKDQIGKYFIGHSNFRLEFIYDDNKEENKNLKTEHKTNEEVLDELIENLPETAEQKDTLKAIWREVWADEN